MLPSAGPLPQANQQASNLWPRFGIPHGPAARLTARRCRTPGGLPWSAAGAVRMSGDRGQAPGRCEHYARPRAAVPSADSGRRHERPGAWPAGRSLVYARTGPRRAYRSPPAASAGGGMVPPAEPPGAKGCSEVGVSRALNRGTTHNAAALLAPAGRRSAEFARPAARTAPPGPRRPRCSRC